MSTRADRIYTADEYLAIDRASEFRSEFVNGRIYAMTGATLPHNTITLNIAGELRNRLRGRGCRVHGEAARLKVSETGMYTYPDVMALCGEASVEDAHGDTLLNPTVIFEVLSPSTEAYDRGEKFAHYANLQSLREYILVSQESVRVEHYVRQGEQWIYSAITDVAESLVLEPLGCELPLSEIYLDVQFPPARGNRWPKLR